MVHFKTLQNGIRLVVNEMSGLMSVTMGILVRTGASQENEKEDGISHFIEHMLFKGTKKRTAFQISDEMDRIGAQMNAFTGKDVTCYYAKSTTPHTAEAFDILADLFLNSTFPEDEMEREKGVVCEEISMNEDTPDDLCLDVLAEAYYGKSGYGRNILGPSKNVKGFTKSDIAAYMAKHYVPSNIVISMAGNINISLAEELVEKYFADMKPVEYTHAEILVNPCGKSLFKKKDIEQIHIGIAYPSLKKEDELYDATNILNMIFGGGMSSRLFQTVREQMGLAYTVYSYLSSYAECGTLSIYAGVNADKYLKSVDAIYKCVEDIKRKNITKEEFLRGKEQLISSSIFAQESTSSQMLIFGREMLQFGRVYNFEERVKKISSVTLDDVNAAIDINFNDENKATAVVGNVKKPIK